MILALVLVTSLFAACGGAEEKTEEPAAKTEDTAADTTADKEEPAAPAEAGTIKLGLLSPTSGDLAVYGQAVFNATEMAVKELNEAGGIDGAQIELVHYDNEGDPTK